MTSPYLDARTVAAELGIKLATLKRMSERREFPELLHVTRGEYRVLRSDYEAWRQGRTTSAVLARAELLLERARAELMGGAS